MLVDYFRIDRDNVNIGLILYGKEPIAMSWPQPTKDQTKTNTRISLLAQRESYARKLSGTTDVPGALRLMRHMFRNPSGYPLQQPRPSAKQIGIMFTYGTVPDYTLVGCGQLIAIGSFPYKINPILTLSRSILK
jgi:hypothetical protein